MINIVLTLLFLLAFVMESSLTTVPLVLLSLLCLAVAKKKAWVFSLAFFSGVFLDILLVRTVGYTSLFFLLVLFTILLYDRKYEIRTLPFVMIASFIGTFLYGIVFSLPALVLQSILSSLVAGGVFLLFTFNKDQRDIRGFQQV